MKKVLESDLAGLAVILAIGGLVVGGIGAASGAEFSEAFWYAVVALAVIPIAVIGTLGVVSYFARSDGDPATHAAVSWILAVFVSIPLTLALAFWVLDSVM